MRRVLLLVLVVSGGCATLGLGDKTKVEDSKLARLPEPDKARVFEAQKNVNIAESNVSSAKVAKGEANQFCRVADAELDAAKSKEKAAGKAMKLGRDSQSASTYSAGDKTGQEASQERLAAEAKKEYCKALVDARDAKVEETEAEVTVAKANGELLKVRFLQQDNMANGIDENPYVSAKQKADDMLGHKQLELSQREGQMTALRSTWEERRQASTRADRNIDAPAIRAPAPPASTPVPATPAN